MVASAPPERWAMIVTMLEAMLKATKGIFSSKTDEFLPRPILLLKG